MKINVSSLLILGLALGLLLLTRCSFEPRYKVVGVVRSRDSYSVEGSRYTPQNHYDYDQVGLASWYGPGCHGKAKAQGEPYNQYAMTAAHRTLPLPTIVRVTNLSNGKSVVLLIDDRGPYKYKGRIIDLSVSAARELGLHGKGLGKVRVQSLPKESAAFALYLQKHCGRFGKNTGGVAWEELYRKNIGGKAGYKNLTALSACVKRLNNLDEAAKKADSVAKTRAVGRTINAIARLNITKSSVVSGSDKIILGRNNSGIGKAALATGKAGKNGAKETSLTTYIKKNFQHQSRATTRKQQQKAKAPPSPPPTKRPKTS